MSLRTPLTIKPENSRIYLKELALENITNLYLSWMNDPEVTNFLESRFQKHTIETLGDYVDQFLNDKNNILLGIFLFQDNQHIGNIKLGPINPFHYSSEVGILIGNKECWGKGYASEAIEMLVNHAFSKLGLHKLTAGCYSNNPGSEKAFLKAGFTREGTRKQQYCSDGTFVDHIMMGIINPLFEPM